MSLRRKTETHEQKLDRLHATKASSLAVFVQAATDLEDVRAEAEEVHSDLDFQISRLRELQDEAAVAANEAGSKAAAIRATFLGA